MSYRDQAARITAEADQRRLLRIEWLRQEATRCAKLATRFGWYESKQCRKRMEEAIDDADRLQARKPTRHIWMTSQEWLPKPPPPAHYQDALR